MKLHTATQPLCSKGKAPAVGMAEEPVVGQGRIALKSATLDPILEEIPTLGGMITRQQRYGLSADRPHYYIVQFRSRIEPGWKKMLTDRGIEILGYLPQNAYLVKGHATILNLANETRDVRWVGHYEPLFKLAPGLLEKAQQSMEGALSPDERSVSVDVRVWTFPGEDGELVANTLQQLTPPFELTYVAPGTSGEGKQLPSAVRLQILPDQLAGFLDGAANMEEVYYIEEGYTPSLHLENAYWIHQSYNNTGNINTAATIWAKGLLGEGQVYSANDSGLDLGFCFMERSSATPLYTSNTCGTAGAPPAEYCQNRSPLGADAQPLITRDGRKVLAYNIPAFCTLTNGVAPARCGQRWDYSAHGTATTQCAVGDNYATLPVESPLTIGHDTSDGCAPLAKVIFHDLGSSDTATAVYPPDNLYGMIAQSFDAGAHVNNNSWGGSANIYYMSSRQIDDVLWDYKDRVITFSAGNAGTAAGTLAPESNSKNAIVVGGSGADATAPENIYPASSCGPTADGRIKPDILASGDNVDVSYVQDNNVTDSDCPAASSVDGTSFSSPIVAGYSLLVREYFTKGYYPSGARNGSPAITPSGALIKAVLLNGARNMSGTGVLNDAPNFNQGWGRMMLDDGLYFSGDARRLQVWDVPEGEGPATGGTWERQIAAGTGQMLKFTLTWYDPQGELAASVELVNDLDLEIIGPTGTIYHGNQFTNGNGAPGGGTGIGSTDRESVANATAWDRLNNVEQAWIIAPTAGTYRVRVHGYNVPMGTADVPRQDFAVAVTGDLSANEGRLAFDKGVFVCGDDIVLNLYDPDAVAPTATITTTFGDSENVALTGTAPYFSGSIAVDYNAAIAIGDGEIQMGSGETLTATYADSLYTNRAYASVDCAGKFAVVKAEMTGGCDGDIFLDAGEAGTLNITIQNNQIFGFSNIVAQLISSDPNIFVQDPDTQGIASLAPGAEGIVSFDVTGKSLVYGTTTFSLYVSADGLNEPQLIEFTHRVETDLITTPGSWTENWEVADACNYTQTCDSATYNPLCWYFVEGPTNCASWAARWDRTAVTACRPQGSYGMKTYACNVAWSCAESMRLISPDITTGPTGSWTRLTTLTYQVRWDMGTGSSTNSTDAYLYLNTPYTYNVRFYSNYDGQWDTNPDFQLETIDFGDWDLASDPALKDDPMTTVSIWFEMTTQARSGASCGADFGWNFDALTLNWINYRYAADTTASCNTCSAPPDPATLTLTNPSANTVNLAWTASTGADHYLIYRAGTGTGNATCASAFTLIATLFGSASTSYQDTVSGGYTYAYKVAAADATDACVSAAANCQTVAVTGSCTLAPSAVAGLVVTDAGTSPCQLNLSWTASTSPCGNGVKYNIYRSTISGFTPEAGNNIGTTAVGATTFADSHVVSGYDALGEPAGVRYYYIVRAVDSVTGAEEGNTVERNGRASAGMTTGTWLDDGGDARPVKMTMGSACGNAIVAWSRSTLQNNTAGGRYSYRSVEEKSANDAAATYPALNCSDLNSPDILLSSTSPTLQFDLRYNLEAQWDGVVLEVSDDAGATWDIVTNTTLNPDYTSDFSASAACPCQPSGCGECGDLRPPSPGEMINECDYSALTSAFGGTLATWTTYTADLAAYASQTVKFRFNLSSDCGAEYAGAYVDNIRVNNARIYTSCTDTCGDAPTSYGIFSAEDISPTLGNGIHLTWPAATAWGDGSASSYLVFRDGQLIYTAPSGTLSYNDNPPDNIQYTYSVLAINSCGAISSNAQFRTATDAASGGAGVPGKLQNSGTPLMVTKSGTDLTLAWGSPGGTCTPTDYGIYEGTLGSWYSHTQILCTDAAGDRTETISPSTADGSYYYLIVARTAGEEGSYGSNTLGAERPRGAATCVGVQNLTVCN